LDLKPSPPETVTDLEDWELDLESLIFDETEGEDTFVLFGLSTVSDDLIPPLLETVCKGLDLESELEVFPELVAVATELDEMVSFKKG